jgi:hypothetical protein
MKKKHRPFLVRQSHIPFSTKSEPMNAGHISHNSCKNYELRERTTEERNAHFLRILTVTEFSDGRAVAYSDIATQDILFALERHPRGRANVSLRRKWQQGYQVRKSSFVPSSPTNVYMQNIILPSVEYLREHMLHLFVLILALIAIKIYIL